MQIWIGMETQGRSGRGGEQRLVDIYMYIDIHV
jgi:hypothetical protein